MFFHDNADQAFKRKEVLMESRAAELKKKPEPQQAQKGERRIHLRITKLEERIAPHCSSHINPQGKYVGHYCPGR
jgi:hypothetical protein